MNRELFSPGTLTKKSPGDLNVFKRFENVNIIVYFASLV